MTKATVGSAAHMTKETQTTPLPPKLKWFMIGICVGAVIQFLGMGGIKYVGN